MDESMCSEETMSVDRNGSCSMQDDESDSSYSTIDLVSTSESDNDVDDLDGSNNKHEEDDDYVDMSESEAEGLQDSAHSYQPDDSSLSVKVEDESDIADVPLDMSQQSIRSAQFENSVSSGNNTKSYKYHSPSAECSQARGKSEAEHNCDFPDFCSCNSVHCIHSKKRVQEKRKNKVTFKLPLKNVLQNKENYPKSANEMDSQGVDNNLISVNEDVKNIDDHNIVKRSKVYDPREFIAARKILTATRQTATSKLYSSKKTLPATSPCCSTGYEQNHINYLREREKLILPFHRQSPQLSERPRLVEFIKGVCSARSLSFTTTHLAVTLLDRFMDAHDIKLNQLNLAAMTSLLLAAKYEECDENIPRIYRLNEFCENNKYTVAFFYTMEAFMLTYFKWHLGFVTPAVFAELFFLRAIQSSDSLELPDNFSDIFDANGDLERPKPSNPPVLNKMTGVKDLVFDQMPHPVNRLRVPSALGPLLECTLMVVDEDSHSNNPDGGGLGMEACASLSSQPPRVVKDPYDTSTSSSSGSSNETISSSSYETISSYETVSGSGTTSSFSGHLGDMTSSGSVTNCTYSTNNNSEHNLSVADTLSMHCTVTAFEETVISNFTNADVQPPVSSSSKLFDHSKCINDDTLTSSSQFIDTSARSLTTHTARGQVSVAMSSPPSGDCNKEELSSRSTSITSSNRTSSTPSRSMEDVPSLPVSPVTSSCVTEKVLSPNVNLRTLTHVLWEEVKQLLNLSMDRMLLIDAVPSEVAAACLLTARRSQGFRPVWPSTMRNLTRYSEQQLERTCSIITGCGDGVLAMFPNTPDSGYRSNAATPAASPGVPSPTAPPSTEDTKSASFKEQKWAAH